MRNAALIVTLCFSAVTSACGVIDPDNAPTGHGCTNVSNNSVWGNADLTLYHNDPRTCQQDSILKNDYVEAGGTLVQPDIHDACPDGSITDYGGGHLYCNNDDTEPVDLREGTSMDLNVYATNASCNDGPFGPPVGSMTDQAFRWNDWQQNGQSHWGAYIDVGYVSGQGGNPNSDCPNFVVRTAGIGTAEALTMVTYVFKNQ